MGVAFRQGADGERTRDRCQHGRNVDPGLRHWNTGIRQTERALDGSPLTRPPSPGENLAGDGIGQGHRGEAHADEDVGPDESIDAARARGDAGADEGDDTGADQQQLAGLEGVGRGGEDRSQDALDQRQNHDHPGLGLRVVEIPSDVGQLDVGSAMDHLDAPQVNGNGTRTLTTEEGPCRATTWT